MKDHNINVQNNGVPFNPGKGFSIASMVLGIVGIVFIWAPPFSFVICVVGLILGIVGKKKAKAVGLPSAMATAGIVCSTIVIVIFVLTIIIGILTFLFNRAAV